MISMIVPEYFILAVSLSVYYIYIDIVLKLSSLATLILQLTLLNLLNVQCSCKVEDNTLLASQPHF